MAAIYEFECKDGHPFQLWSDAPRCCPECGSDLLRRVFKTPPMIGTGKPAKVDALVKRELDARGITNIQGGGHEGDKEKVTYKSTPEQLAADKVMRDIPIMKDATAVQQIDRQIKQRWGQMGVKGVINAGLHKLPEHDTVKSTIVNAGRNDRYMTNRIMRKDPQNLQVTRK